MLLVVTGILFSGLAMIETRRHKIDVWKSSSLPLLFHGLSGEERRMIGTLNKLSEMEKEAMKMTVRLGKRDDEGAWTLLALD